MSDPGNGARPGRQAWAAPAFALAALAAAWHPISAPIGLLVGLASGGLALAVRYRAADRTLTDAEADAAHQRIVTRLVAQVGAGLRS